MKKSIKKMAVHKRRHEPVGQISLVFSEGQAGHKHQPIVPALRVFFFFFFVSFTWDDEQSIAVIKSATATPQNLHRWIAQIDAHPMIPLPCCQCH
jgi:hypothetical protein